MKAKRHRQTSRRHSRKVGLPPGTLVYIGDERAESVRITCIDYDEKGFLEKEVANIQECFPFKNTPTVTWINIDGLKDVGIIEKLGVEFDLHTLMLEDILHTRQRPKFEDFDKYTFFVLRMLTYNDQTHTVENEQISLILGPNYVISFQERVGDVFDNIRDRIRTSKGRLRKQGPDYLAYALLDAVVDNYFLILEKIGERIEGMEEDLLANPTEKTLQKIHVMKREMLLLRKSIWPLRELISGVERCESDLISDTTEVYFRDLYDHTIQIMDTVESFRDLVSGMLDIYLSSISNRMNAVMKVLTIIATIFIPLTFIVGVYGMNFKHMPELKCKYAYPALWLFMITLAGLMVKYFRRKKWL